MGEATLEHTLADLAMTLVAEVSFADTIERIAELSCDVAAAAVAARLELIDGHGSPTYEAGTGGASRFGESGDRRSAPLIATGVTLGSISLYAPESGSFTDADAAALRAFAARAAVLVANARAYWELHEVAAGLQAAMQSRAVIEQAKGMVMAREACTADEAFTRLARTSQRDNIKLRELSRQIVDGEHDGRFA